MNNVKARTGIETVIEKYNLSSDFKNFVISLFEKFESSRKEFSFLLVGRTGVGKSSVVNALIDCDIAPTDPYEATTMEVKSYESEINGIQFTVIDTPGLCDDLDEQGNDQNYLELMSSKVKQVDAMWFVSPLNEPRVRSDEKKGIKLISEAFSSNVWEHAVIVFTFADKVDRSEYAVALQRRTELIRKEIAQYTGTEIADKVPSVAVSNKNETTPDGQKWLGELYVKVLEKISERGVTPFFLATAPRLSKGSNSKREPNWRLYGEDFKASIELDDFQIKKVSKIVNAIIIPGLVVAGAAIGLPFGAVGAVVGGAVGAAIGLFAWLSE